MDATKIMPAQTSRKIKEIIIHCSATPAGRDVTAADIRRWHINDRHFSDIGYHYVVRLDGTVEIGRPLEKVGAHCLHHNAHSIGICYIGGLNTNDQPADTRTPAQKNTLTELISLLKARFPNAQIFGHRNFAAKDCPCFNANKEYAKIRKNFR